MWKPSIESFIIVTCFCLFKMKSMLDDARQKIEKSKPQCDVRENRGNRC